MSDNESRCTWTKCDDGWKVRIPAEMYANWTDCGETAFPVCKKNGERREVEIVKASRPFKGKDGNMWVLGTPQRTDHGTGRRYTKRRPASRRCEECGSTRNVHEASDMSGIGCLLCDRCDDGTASIC